MQAEQIREARPCRIKACGDSPIRRSQTAVLSENLKCLYLPLVELHDSSFQQRARIVQVLIHVLP